MKKGILGISNEITEKCVRCGLCRSVCPVFNATDEEPSVSRDKIFLADLINKGKIDIDEEAADFFNRCTTCLRCQEVCPVGVDYETIIVSARKKSVETFGVPLEKKAEIDLVSNKTLLNLFTKVFAPLSIITKKSKSPQNRLLPISIPAFGKTVIPKPHFIPFNYKNRIFEVENERGRVLFFTGCAFNNFYTKTAMNAVKVLNALGYTVIVPKDQWCCGASAYYSGDMKTFKNLKDKNLKSLSRWNVDFMVLICATGGNIFKKLYKELPFKVYDFLEVLHENLETIGKWKSPENLRITWHHPCHIIRGQKIPRSYPIDILKLIENVEFTNLNEADMCCGLGGSFKLSYPKVSERIQLKKAKNVQDTKADMVLTECPGCVMNIAEGLEKINSNTQSVHIADFLASCLNTDKT